MPVTFSAWHSGKHKKEEEAFHIWHQHEAKKRYKHIVVKVTGTYKHRYPILLCKAGSLGNCRDK